MTENLVAVCAFDTEYLFRMIRRGASVAKEMGCALEVIFMLSPDAPREENARALEYAYQCARHLGAGLTAYYAQEPVRMLQAKLWERGARYVMVSDRMAARERRTLAPFAKLMVYERQAAEEIQCPLDQVALAIVNH